MASPASRLLTWYGTHKRDLPWRGRVDPYRIWLSEIMLQQTRVDTVVPRYERFLTRFPTVEALAAADEEAVLAEWSGLGYYRRARHLHRAARQVVERGEFPGSAGEWRRLPGVGEYTAAALGSIVCGEATPALDGNGIRVLSRLHAISGSAQSGSGRRLLLRLAEDLLDRQRPGDSNQALMELGATVCTPRRPRCGACPLRPRCQAHLEGEPERYPERRRKRAIETHRLLVAVVRNGEEALLFRRNVEEDILSGLWELPWVEQWPASTLESRLGSRYGGRWRLGRNFGTIRHQITYRRLEVTVAAGVWQKVPASSSGRESGWFDGAARGRLPQSSLVAKALALVSK